MVLISGVLNIEFELSVSFGWLSPILGLLLFRDEEGKGARGGVEFFGVAILTVGLGMQRWRFT